MKVQVAKFIPQAMTLLVDRNIAIVDGDSYSYKKVYEGYISSFGPAVISSGLLPVVVMYAKRSESSNSEGDKTKILDCLNVMIFNRENPDNSTGHAFLQNLINLEGGVSFQMEEKILDAVTALKLAIRTFKEKK